MCLVHHSTVTCLNVTRPANRWVTIFGLFWFKLSAIPSVTSAFVLCLFSVCVFVLVTLEVRVIALMMFRKELLCCWQMCHALATSTQLAFQAFMVCLHHISYLSSVKFFPSCISDLLAHSLSLMHEVSPPWCYFKGETREVPSLDFSLIRNFTVRENFISCLFV